MSSDSIDNNKNLPPWLRDVPLPPRPVAAPPAPAAPAAGASALPDWLRDMGADQPTANDVASAPASEITLPGAAPDTLPDWLRQPPSQPAVGAEVLPDWLRDLAEPAPAELPPPQPAAAPPKPASSDLPDWLRAEPDTPAPGAPAPPAELFDTPPPAPEPAAEDLPDWLRGLAEPADTSPPAPPAYTGETAVYPNWLGEPGPAAEPPPAPTPDVPPAPAAPDTLPGWLSDSADSTGDLPAISPFSFDEAGPPSAPSQPSWLANDVGAGDDSGIPSWLGAAAAPAPEHSGPASEAGVPDWLNATPTPAPAASDPGPPAWPDAPQASLPSSPAGGADVPAWLSATPTPADSSPAGDADAPAWLHPEPAPFDAPTQPSTPDLPLWMQDRGIPEPEQPSARPAERPADNLPDWLSDTVTAPAEPAPPPGALSDWPQSADAAPTQPAAPPADNLPDWLRDTATAPAEPAPPPLAPTSPPAAPPASDELPAWLRSTPEPEPAPPAPPALPVAGDLPTWLKPDEAPPAPADDLPPWLRDEHGQPLPTAGAAGGTNLPTWLRGAPEAAPTPPAPAAFEPPAAPSAQPAPSAEAGLVGGIELPPWLRPAEPEPAKEEINPTDARSLDWLTRLGTPDDEPEATAAVPLRLAPPVTPARSSAQLSAIALLESLAAAPYPQPAEAPAPAAASIWQRVGIERLLYLALLLALVAALISPAPALLGLNQPPATAEAEALFAQIETLGANDVVLVGYEWDARRSGELRPLERAVLDHLIAHKVKLVLVSTDSQGSLLLYDLRDRLRDAGYKPSGEDYILLGYKPGAELALRTMARSFASALQSDFQGEDASGSILATDAQRQPRLNSLADFAMILVLADDASDVQSWMEQAHPSARRADGAFVPFGFLMPAEIQPIVQPYLNATDVLHLDGQIGALAYRQLRDSDPAAQAQLAGEAGQQRTGTLAYLALLLIGATAVGVHSAVTRRRKRS